MKTKLKKNACTMTTLRYWYENTYSSLNRSPKKKKHLHSDKLLVVIIPDFESFNYNVLQDFVLIVR